MKLAMAITGAALALAAPASAQKAPATVPIALYSYGYAPEPIVLTAGQPVTLQLINRSGGGHSFKAVDFFESAKIVSGTIHHGEIHLKGGESATVTLIPLRGSYELHCSHFFHDQLGMNSRIEVR